MKKVKGSFLFVITDSGGREHKWLIDLKTGSGHVEKGDQGERQAGRQAGTLTVRRRAGLK